MITDGLKAGVYEPRPVRAVQIPKSNGKVRQLGIPTVADRVVQASLSWCWSDLRGRFRPGVRVRSGERRSDRGIPPPVSRRHRRQHRQGSMERLRERITDKRVLWWSGRSGRDHGRGPDHPGHPHRHPAGRHPVAAAGQHRPVRLDRHFRAKWNGYGPDGRGRAAPPGPTAMRLVSRHFVVLVHGGRLAAALVAAASLKNPPMPRPSPPCRGCERPPTTHRTRRYAPAQPDETSGPSGPRDPLHTGTESPMGQPGHPTNRSDSGGRRPPHRETARRAPTSHLRPAPLYVFSPIVLARRDHRPSCQGIAWQRDRRHHPPPPAPSPLTALGWKASRLIGSVGTPTTTPYETINGCDEASAPSSTTSRTSSPRRVRHRRLGRPIHTKRARRRRASRPSPHPRRRRPHLPPPPPRSSPRHRLRPRRRSPLHRPPRHRRPRTRLPAQWGKALSRRRETRRPRRRRPRCWNLKHLPWRRSARSRTRG